MATRKTKAGKAANAMKVAAYEKDFAAVLDIITKHQTCKGPTLVIWSM